MNLWDKSLLIRQLTVLVVALFFFSCEDETSLLGFQNPSPKFNVSFIEIPLESSMLLVDSVITDNLYTQGSGTVPFNAIGEYHDAIFGTMRAETYLQVLPSNASKIEETSVYDSVTFQMRLNFYSYGFSNEQVMKFNIHELTTTTPNLDSGRNRYYYNSTLPYNAQPIGTVSVLVNYDSLKKQAARTSGQDTMLVYGKLSNSFGNHLFTLALNDPGSVFSDPALFVQEIKGLVMTPAESNGILGINPVASLSKIILHYHTVANGAVAGTLEKSFTFGGSTYDPNFTNYTVNRSSSEFSGGFLPYQSFTPASGVRGIQSGAPLLTKIDLKPFYKFADTVETAVINSAELVIDGIESTAGTYVHSQFMLKILNANDQFANPSVTADYDALLPYLKNTTIFSPGGHFYVESDLKTVNGQPATASLNYNSTSNAYSGFITLFTQDLIRNKKSGAVANPTRISYLAVYPMNPGVSTAVNRTVFNASNIKLRIYYTRPSSTVNLN